MTRVEANPTNQALCLFLSDPNNLDPNSGNPGGPNGACGPFSETPTFTYDPMTKTGSSTPWVTATGQVIAAVRPLGPLFDTNPFVSTVANSRYNSLQLELRHQAGSVSFDASYTYGKCMDNASGLEEFTYPFDPRRSIALCNFDVTQSFVLSYDWVLPFAQLVSSGWAKGLVDGWTISGIMRFATGLPVTLKAKTTTIR